VINLAGPRSAEERDLAGNLRTVRTPTSEQHRADMETVRHSRGPGWVTGGRRGWRAAAAAWQPADHAGRGVGQLGGFAGGVLPSVAVSRLAPA
jgi:hypothetical protein